MRRFALALLLAAIPGAASAQTMKTMKVAEHVALVEWAGENCGIKPPFDISDMLATVMSENLHGWVMITRANLDKLYGRHGRESACKAAEKAVAKIPKR